MMLFEMFSVQLMTVFSPQMKTKVLASAALGAPLPSDTESDTASIQPPPPPAMPQSDPDPDSSLKSSRSKGDAGSRTSDAETTRTDLVSMQRELLSKLDKTARKSPVDRQKDTFADFMKEVTYTFPPPMWLRFQGEVGEVQTLLQKYQLDNMEPQPPMMPAQPAVTVPLMQTMHPMQSQQPGPSNPMASSSGWQPPPSHWPDAGQFLRPTSVWGSQEAGWMQAQQQHQHQQHHQHQHQQQSPSQQRPLRPQSAPSIYVSRTSTPHGSPPQAVSGNFTGLSSVLGAAMADISFPSIAPTPGTDDQLPDLATTLATTTTTDH